MGQEVSVNTYKGGNQEVDLQEYMLHIKPDFISGASVDDETLPIPAYTGIENRAVELAPLRHPQQDPTPLRGGVHLQSPPNLIPPTVLGGSWE